MNKLNKNQAIIYIPALVLAEILYLSEKHRIECNLDRVKAYLTEFTTIIEKPLDFSIMLWTRQITDIIELHDRIIAGTALALNVPLITNDPIITASQFVQTIW